jgi:hypothetical protein
MIAAERAGQIRRILLGLSELAGDLWESHGENFAG